MVMIVDDDTRSFARTRHDRFDAVGDHTVFYREVPRTAADETKKPLVLFNRIYYGLGRVISNYP